MKVKHTLWAAIILAALGAYVYYFERGPAPEEGGARPLSQVLGYRTKPVVKLQLDRPGDPLWMVRDSTGGEKAWRLEKPVSAAADGEECERIVRELSDTMVDRVLKEGVSDLQPFGLAKPGWEMTIAAGGASYVLQAGSRSADGSSIYLKRKDRPEVLVVAASEIDGLQAKKADELRDKSVTAFKKEDAQRFELMSGGRTIRVERSGPEEWRITAPVAAKARKEIVTAILMSFERLKGTRIVEDNPKDLKQFGLEPPAAQVSVWVRGEGTPRVALLGKKDASGNIYAKGLRSSTVVTVYSYVLSDAQKTVEDLKEPEPVKAEKTPGNIPAPPVPPPGAPAGNAPAKMAPATTPPPANAPAKSPGAADPAPKAPTLDESLKATLKKK